MSTVERLYEEVMALSDEEREAYIELLWSIPVRPTAEVQRTWVAEAERRMHEVEDGAKMAPGDIVHARMRARIRAARD